MELDFDQMDKENGKMFCSVTASGNLTLQHPKDLLYTLHLINKIEECVLEQCRKARSDGDGTRRIVQADKSGFTGVASDVRM